MIRVSRILWAAFLAAAAIAQPNGKWKAGPMTYTVDGRQFVGVAVGSTVMTFAL
jgi:hypothetical protein